MLKMLKNAKKNAKNAKTIAVKDTKQMLRNCWQNAKKMLKKC